MQTPDGAFLSERASGIGGSDIHHVFSLEPYGCSRRLWYEKRGAQADNPSEDTGAMRRGRKLESLIAEEYAEKSGREVAEVGIRRHRDHPQLMVHVDRLVRDGGRTDGGVLECKTANRQVFWRMKREGLLVAYILQVQHAMLVTETLWGSFALLWPDGWQLLWWDENRDEELCTKIRDEALKFWALVENGPAPEAFPPEDERCHHCPYSYGCQGEVMEKLLRVQGEGTEVDATLAPLVSEFLETRELRDQAKEMHEGVVEQLKAAMGDRLLVQVPGAGKVHFKPLMEWDTEHLEIDRPDIARAFRTRWDLTALSKAHPELEKDYKRVGLTRPLRVYPLKGT